MTSVHPRELAHLRGRAETQLRARPATVPGVPAVDLQWLQHELDIHRIELTLQVEELQRAQAETEASLARYTDLFDFAPVGYFNLTEDGTIRLVNPQGAQLIGTERSRLIGRRMGLFVAVADRPVLADFLAQVFATAERQSCNLSLIGAGTGSPKLVHFDARRTADGQECLAMVWDRTEQLRVEHAHGQLAMAVEQAAETIVITDLAGTILYANPAFERTTGYSVAEAVGQNPRILKSGVQDTEFYLALWEVLHRGETWSGRFINRRKDGTKYEEEATISPVRDANGRVVNYVAVKRDITREVQLESQLRQAQKMEAIGLLSGGIAHDFNNVLGAIIGNAQLAALDLAPAHPAAEALDQILVASRRAAEIVRQILAFARQESRDRCRVDLEPIVAESVRLLRATLPAGVTIVASLGTGLPAVLADETQIQQVIVNLATNAWHAMEGRSARLTVGLDAVMVDAALVALNADLHPGDYLRLRVADTGTGMDASLLERIFEPFFTTKPPGKGTGLGLSVVHGIMKAHGGAILVRSEPGVGTDFDLFLPTVAVADPKAASGSAPLRRGQGQHLLVIDDDEAMLGTTARILERLGYRVTAEREGAAGLAAFEAAPDAFALVFTDLNMPGLSGIDVARAIRRRRPELPVLLSSGYLTEELRGTAAKAGIQGIVRKPASMAELGEAVGQALPVPA
jgi:PAS domain S-box-containing protein